MDLFPYFKSVLEYDRASVVLCDLAHTIIYMNPAAKEHYAKYGGEKLVGRNLMNCHAPSSRQQILRVLDWFSQSEDNNMIFTTHSDSQNRDIYMVALRDDDKKLIGYYEKHEYRDLETAKCYDFSHSLV